MLDILDPCNYPDAWWQHILMLAVPFILGLLWAKASTNSNADELSVRLADLDAELADCQKLAKTTETTIKNNLVEEIPVSNSFVATAATAKSKKDDLKVVEGIGPKIEELFNNAGILTFEQLANTPASRLKEILEAAGSRFQMHDPTTWPAQSKLAEDGKWEELKSWQDELNKGIT